MREVSLCIFANFFIDNEVRFQRMKDSFYSFRDVLPSQWVVNIRGSLKEETAHFLHSQLNDDIQFSFIDTKHGWATDSLYISSQIRSKYTMIWIEDHLLVSNIKYFSSVVYDADINNVDQIIYSWFVHKDGYESLKNLYVSDFINVYCIDRSVLRCIHEKRLVDFNSTSLCSIYKTSFFVDLLKCRKPFLRRWPTKLPFELEHLVTDVIKESIITAYPNNELFASIDDDHGKPGYSLISRGMYNDNVSREDILKLEYRSNFKHLNFLKRFALFINLYTYLHPVINFILRLKYTFYG